MGIFTGILIGLVTSLTLIYLWAQKRPKGFPPGPRWGFPLLGHLPLLGREQHTTAISWIPKYGPIVGINFGSLRCVMISDYKLIKEAFNESTFTGRLKIPFVLDRLGGSLNGIIFNQGKDWQEQRRFTLRHLRDFGFGTKSIEGIVQYEISELIERFKESVGTPISTVNKFNVAVVNALWTIISGERLAHDDPGLNKLITSLTENAADSGLIVAVTGFVPWLGDLIGYERINAPMKPAISFVKPFIDEHFKSHQQGNPRDFLDRYIDEMKSTTDSSSSFHISRQKSILYTTLDLFFAGAETTSTTLTWIFLYMARNQHVQCKLAEEIQSVVGNSRLPSLNDRPNMPYTESVIHEVMRSATLLPMGLFHSTTEDLDFHGYRIPKDTMIVPNLYEVHNNIGIWSDPENFRPERFLSKDGTKFERHEGFVPFSTGKRVCLGETLARDELFLFTSSLFQAFQVDIDPNAVPPSLKGVPGGVFMPEKHKLVLTFRN